MGMWNGAVSVPSSAEHSPPVRRGWLFPVPFPGQLPAQTVGAALLHEVSPLSLRPSPCKGSPRAKKGWPDPPLPLGFGASWSARGSTQVLVQYWPCWIHYLKEKPWVKIRQHKHSVWWQPAFVCYRNGGITLQHPVCVCVCLVSLSLYLVGLSSCYR